MPLGHRGDNFMATADHMDASLISARLDRLPATRTIWIMILMLSLGQFFELYEQLLTSYIAPGLVRSGILSATTPGLFGTQGIASFIAALFSGLTIGTMACGFVADKYGRRTIFTFSLLWYAAASAMMAFQTTAFGLNFWRFISGIGLGVEMMTIGAYLAELSPKHIRGRAFAVALAIGFLATPAAAFFSYLLVPNAPYGIDGWRWVVGIGVLSAVAVWWLRLRLPESPRWLAQKGRVAEADAILTRIEAQVAKDIGQALPPIPAPEPIIARASFKDMWVAPYGKRTLMLTMFHVIQSIGYYGFANWVPTLLISQGIAVTSSLLYGTIIALAAPLGPLIGIFVADKFERKHVIVVMAGVNIVCGLIFSQMTHAGGVIVMGVLLTIAGNMIAYTFLVYQQELFPTGIRARASGFVYSWSRASTVFNSFVIAFFLNHYGTTGVFLFIAAAMVAVMLIIGIMGERTRNISLEKLSG